MSDNLNRRMLIGGALAVAATAHPALAVASKRSGKGYCVNPLSSCPEEAGFSAWKKLAGDGYITEIYLDGEKQDLVEAVGNGWVRRAKVDQDGNIYTLDDYSIARETLYGKVDVFPVYDPVKARSIFGDAA